MLCIREKGFWEASKLVSDTLFGDFVRATPKLGNPGKSTHCLIVVTVTQGSKRAEPFSCLFADHDDLQQKVWLIWEWDNNYEQCCRKYFGLVLYLLSGGVHELESQGKCKQFLTLHVSVKNVGLLTE